MSETGFSDESAHRVCPLPDGQKLGFAEGGDPQGVPVFYFHGFPGSRLEAPLLPAKGLRLIGVDRPGYGLSTACPWRKLADWPEDIGALADFLEIGEFGVIGVSGGGPYASSVAHGLGARVNALALICGLGPPEAPGMTFGGSSNIAIALRFLPARLTLAAFARRVMLSDRALRQMRTFGARRGSHPASDQEFREGPMMAAMVKSWREGLKRSSLGIAADARIYGEPWHFELEDIKVPTAIWHGRADTVVPFSIGEHYAAKVPKADAHFTDDDGHFSIVVNSYDAIANFLKSKA